MENPKKDLAYWQKKLGLRPTIRGTYVDERGDRKDIFGGETTYDPELGSYFFPQGTKDALSKISVPPPLSEDVRKVLYEAMHNHLDKTTDFNVYSGDISVPNEETTTNFPDHPHLQGSYIDKLYEGKYHFSPGSLSPGGVKETHALIPMPSRKDITPDHLGIVFEETGEGHGDRKKITNEGYLQYALWDMMTRPEHQWDPATRTLVSDYPELRQPGKLNKIFELIGMEPISTLPGTVKREPLPPLSHDISLTDMQDDMTTKTDMDSSSIFDSAEAIDNYNPNYIADQNLKDVQGVATEFFHPAWLNQEYGDDRVVDIHQILEENYTKERGENFIKNLKVNGQQPFKDAPPGYYNWSKFSYLNPFFREMQTQNDMLAHYLALTGPLRDRTKPLWKNEVRPPFMQKKFEDDELYNKWPAMNRAYERGFKGATLQPNERSAWTWLPRYHNPYPDFAKHGSATNYFNALIDPLQKASWWQPMSSRSIYNDPNYGKYPALDDPSNIVSRPFTHVTSENEDSFIPYFKDWEDSVYSGGDMFRHGFKFNDDEEWEELLAKIENREYIPYFERKLLKDE